jgi:hypothetical protein
LPEEPNFLSHAFKSQYNLIGLGTAVGFSILSGTFLPLLIAAGIELVALPLVSGSSRFQRLVRARQIEESARAREEKTQAQTTEMLRVLDDFERGRYRQLEGLAHEMRHNYRGLDSTSRVLVDELEGKLDFLLSFYLRMRHSIARYQHYFSTTDPEKLQERLFMLEQEIESAPERVKEIKTRTKAVLGKRMERYQKALENKQLIDAQTETVQEVLQLLRDQSYSMRDPRSITEQLDGLLSSAEETERGVKDMEELLALEQDALTSGLPEDIEADILSLPPPLPERQAVPPPPMQRPIPSMRSAPPPSPPPPPRKKVIQ